MTFWQEKLLQANHSYHLGDWPAAEKDYLKAAQLLEDAWFSELDNPQLMMDWISAMHHLARLYEEQSQVQKASEYLVLPFRRVTTLLKSGGLSDEFLFPLIKGVQSTIQPLLAFSKRYPICKCCQQYLDQAEQWLQEEPLKARLLNISTSNSNSFETATYSTIH